MKRLLVFLAILFLLPRVRSAVALDRPPGRPEIRIEDGPARVHLVASSVKATLRGHLARTELVLTYRNEEGRDLKGELTFPLPGGASVVDAGLYFNGNLRHAVAVDRELGRRAFDATVRRRIDPALAEWISEDVFRLDVYPIPAYGEKKVYVAYDQDLACREGRFLYSLDFGSGDELRWFHLEVDTEEGFEVDSSELPLERTPRGWVANAFDQVVDARFTFRRTPSPGATALVEYWPSDNKYYLSIPLGAPPAGARSARTRHVILLWDSSGTAAAQDRGVLFDFLKRFLTEQEPNVDATVVPFHFKVEPPVRIRDVASPLGFKRLAALLESLPEAGGTSLEAVVKALPDLEARAPRRARVILVTDGRSSLTSSEALTRAIDSMQSSPLLVVNASPQFDHVTLNRLARSSGGWFVNLTEDDLERHVRAAMNQIPQARAWLDGSAVENPDVALLADRPLTVASKVAPAAGSVFRQVSGRARETIPFEIRALTDGLGLVRSAWVRSQITDRLAARDARGLLDLGMRFRVVTPRTSLIVLDTWRDYERFGIEMPPDVRAEYERVHPALSTTPAPLPPPLVWRSGSWALQGQVVDTEYAPLPGATVRLMSPAGEVLRETLTDEYGQFAFNQTPLSGFQIVTSMPGFNTIRHVFERGAPDGRRIWIPLPLAAVSETITVTGETPFIDTKSTSMTTAWRTFDAVRTASPRVERREWATTPLARADAPAESTMDPAEREARIDAVVACLRARNLSDRERMKAYMAARVPFEGYERFHVESASALAETHRSLAIRVLTDLSETFMDRPYILRLVAERLEAWGEADLARALRERVSELERAMPLV